MHQRPYRHTPVPVHKLPHQAGKLPQKRANPAKRAADLLSFAGRRRPFFSSFTFFSYFFLRSDFNAPPLLRSSSAQRRVDVSGQFLTRLCTQLRTKRLMPGLPLFFFWLLDFAGPSDGTTTETRPARASTHGTPFSGEEAVSHHASTTKCGRSHCRGAAAKTALLQLEFRPSSLASLLSTRTKLLHELPGGTGHCRC